MIKRSTMVMVLMMLAALAQAMPRIDNPSGPLTRAETLKALIEVGSWLDRAEALCAKKDSSDCTVRLRVSVAAAGGHPQCELEKSAVRDETVRAVYCQVMGRANFPVKSADSAFSLVFLGKEQAAAASAVEAAKASCGNSQGKREDRFVKPCFDQYNDQLMGMYRQALHDHPDMRGLVTFKIQIRSSGIAYGIDVVGTDPTMDPDFVEAVTRVVKSMDFGVATEDATVQHSFNFYP